MANLRVGAFVFWSRHSFFTSPPFPFILLPHDQNLASQLSELCCRRFRCRPYSANAGTNVVRQSSSQLPFLPQTLRRSRPAHHRRRVPHLPSTRSVAHGRAQSRV